MLDLDGRPTFKLTLTDDHFVRPLEIMYGFWRRHVRMGALKAPIYFVTVDNTWLLELKNNTSKIWINSGWKRFRHDGLVVGDRIHFTLVNIHEITFYVLIEKA